MNPKKRAAVKSAGASLVHPVQDGASLVYGGNIHVRALETDSGTVKVYAKVHGVNDNPTIPANGDPDNGAPTGFTELPEVSTGIFEAAIPSGGAGIGVWPTSGNNRGVTVIQSINGLFDGKHTRATFIAMSTSVNMEVKGYQCPWFAFADDDATGPWGETPMSKYKPAVILVPEHAASCAVTASGSWGHAELGPSGPGGYGGNISVNSAYINAAYHSENLSGGPFAINSLVYLIKPATGTTATIYRIGTSATISSLTGNGDVPLCLGMWDGFQWNELPVSNWGTASVNLTWTAAP